MRVFFIAITIMVIISFSIYTLFHKESVPPAEDVEQAATTTGEYVPPAVDPTLREEAESYISEITSANGDKIDVTTADDFVSGKQTISLSSDQDVELTTPAELLSDSDLSADAPITLLQEQEQVELNTPAQILADAHGNLDSRVRILKEGQIRDLTVGELLDEYPDSSGSSVSIIKKLEQPEITTAKEILDDQSIDKDKEIKVIKKPYKLQSTTVDELLMGEIDVSDDNIFYVKNVTRDDNQGIWGIVHNSLVKNFASGIALRRNEEIKKYQVDIPVNADELLENHSSSFLGRMIDNKTSESFVYNYNEGKMGKNPDLIFPGQEIVIVKFTPEELINIYQHFVARSNP